MVSLGTERVREEAAKSQTLERLTDRLSPCSMDVGQVRVVLT